MTTRLVVLISGLVLFAVSHSVLAGGGMRRRLELALGGRPQAYRLLYNAFAALLLVGTLAFTLGEYPVVWRAEGAAHVALRLVQVSAVLGFALTLRTFDTLQFLGFRSLGAPGLKTTGVYRICRHPLYLFTCILFSAWPTMDLRMLIVGIWLWLYSYVGSHFEERRLLRRFGEQYRLYRALRPRLLPLPLPGLRRGT